MNMVWKTTTKVAVGYHDIPSTTRAYIVFWYCPKKEKTGYVDHRKDANTPKNVGAECLKKGYENAAGKCTKDGTALFSGAELDATKTSATTEVLCEAECDKMTDCTGYYFKSGDAAPCNLAKTAAAKAQGTAEAGWSCKIRSAKVLNTCFADV